MNYSLLSLAAKYEFQYIGLISYVFPFTLKTCYMMGTQVIFYFCSCKVMMQTMAIAASSKDSTNFARLYRLLVDGGAQALRLQFDRIYPPASLNAVLKCYKPKFKELKQKRFLKANHWKVLYPAVSSSVSSEQFDMTLLTVLLRNICGLNPPSSGWDSPPPSSDKSIEANIARVKDCRNRFFALARRAPVDDETFNALWQDVSAALIALGIDAASINKLKSEGIDPYMERNYRELLERDENSIKKKLDDITGTTV